MPSSGPALLLLFRAPIRVDFIESNGAEDGSHDPAERWNGPHSVLRDDCREQYENEHQDNGRACCSDPAWQSCVKCTAQKVTHSPSDPIRRRASWYRDP